MEIGYTMLERAILGLSGAAYCTGYSYAAWYFLKRNHRADEIPGMFRALTVLLLFLRYSRFGRNMRSFTRGQEW